MSYKIGSQIMLLRIKNFIAVDEGKLLCLTTMISFYSCLVGKFTDRVKKMSNLFKNMVIFNQLG